jgi:uncharacterized membrane protein HdeD (DUF308 family)
MIVTSPIDQTSTWTRAQIVAVIKGWWVLLLTGLVSILAGGVIVFSEWTVDGLVAFVGTLLIVRGALTMFSVPVDGSLRTWSVVLGVVEVFVGIGVFAWPGPTLLVVATSIGWLLIFRGTMAIIGSIMSRGLLPYWGLILATGILEAVVGLYLLGRPGLTLVATVLAIGFASMLYGALEVVTAFGVKNLPWRSAPLDGAHSRADDAGRLLDQVGGRRT